MVSEILLATDGQGDAGMRQGGRHRLQLPIDLQATATAGELFAQYQRHCDDSENDDDITLVRLTAVGGGAGACRHCFSSPGTLAGLSKLQQQVRQLLEAEGVMEEQLDNFELALSEALMNAFEHGCLNIGANKQRLMLEGEYDDLLMAAEPCPGVAIDLTLTLIPRMDRLQVWLEVADPGTGFDAARRLDLKGAASATSGRGFMMMQRSVDLVRRNPAGNRLVLMKMFDGSALLTNPRADLC